MSRNYDTDSTDSDVEEEYRDPPPEDSELSTAQQQRLNASSINARTLRNLQGIEDIEQYVRAQNILMAMQLAFSPISNSRNNQNNNNNNNNDITNDFSINVDELEQSRRLEQQRNQLRNILFPLLPGLEQIYRNQQMQNQQIMIEHNMNILNGDDMIDDRYDDNSSDSSLESERNNIHNNDNNNSTNSQRTQTQTRPQQPLQPLEPIREEDVAHLTTQERIEMHRVRLLDRQNAIEGSSLDLPVTHNDPYDWAVQPSNQSGIRAWINPEAFSAPQMKGWSIFILVYGFAGMFVFEIAVCLCEEL